MKFDRVDAAEKGLLIGNCEEELPKKPVGRLSVNCRLTVGQLSADRFFGELFFTITVKLIILSSTSANAERRVSVYRIWLLN